MSFHPCFVLAALAAVFSSGCGDSRTGTGKPEASPSPQAGSTPGGGHQPDRKAPHTSGTTLTSANFKKVKSSSTREELVALFGMPRTAVTGAEVARSLLGDPQWGIAYESEVAPNDNPVDLLAYLEDGR